MSIPPEHSEEANRLLAALAAPFPAEDVKHKPQAIKGERALAVAYVDARAVMDRLDDVLGVGGWQDDYDCLEGGAVICRLRVRLAGEWVMKVDVGGESEQPDEHDRRKAAFSDALKRAAVKFGVGRYLYRLPAQWVDYDPVKKQLRMPPPAPKPAPEKKRPEPTTGAELVEWLKGFDAYGVMKGWWLADELWRHVLAKVDHPPSAMKDWPPEAVAAAVALARKFRDERPR
jgi:hypothetical protein